MILFYFCSLCFSTSGSKTAAATTSVGSDSAAGTTESAASVYPPGTRLRIRYGKFKNQKVYEAKVLDGRRDASGALQWLVHYAGWNNRCDHSPYNAHISSIYCHVVAHSGYLSHVIVRSCLTM